MIAFRRGVGSASRNPQTPEVAWSGVSEGRVRPMRAEKVEPTTWTIADATSSQTMKGSAILIVSGVIAPVMYRMIAVSTTENSPIDQMISRPVKATRMGRRMMFPMVRPTPDSRT